MSTITVSITRAKMEDWLAEACALRQEILKRREGIPLDDEL